MTEQPNTLPDDGLWLGVTDLAARKGLSKAAVSERVARFETAGLIKTRPGKGRAKLVNLAEFNRAAGQVGDLAREQGAATRRHAETEVSPVMPTIGDGSPVYTREQARHMAYRADLSRMERDERIGQLLRRDKLHDALRELSACLVHHLESIGTWADEIAAAIAKEGAHGARVLLKAKVTQLRSTIAADFQKIAEAAPEFDPPLEEEAQA